MTTMCLCGEKFTAPTPEAAWRLLDQHTDQEHGRRFSTGVIRLEHHTGGKARARRAPLTTQGGNS